VERPAILLPCFHGLCPTCFEDVGGAVLRSGPTPFASAPHPVEGDGVDEKFVPPPTHVV
jgi:hypothetical protein